MTIRKSKYGGDKPVTKAHRCTVRCSHRMRHGGDDQLPSFDQYESFMTQVKNEFDNEKAYAKLSEVLGKPSDAAKEVAADFTSKGYIKNNATLVKRRYIASKDTFALIVAYLLLRTEKPNLSGDKEQDMELLHKAWGYSCIYMSSDDGTKKILDERREPQPDPDPRVRVISKDSWEGALSKPADGSQGSLYKLEFDADAKQHPIVNGWRLRWLSTYTKDMPCPVQKEMVWERLSDYRVQLARLENVDGLIQSSVVADGPGEHLGGRRKLKKASRKRSSSKSTRSKRSKPGSKKSNIRKQPVMRRTDKQVSINGHSAIVYQGPRGGEYILRKGKYVSLVKATTTKSKARG